MSKTLFSLHLDDDLKIQATTRAEAENRSLANLIENAVIAYLNPPAVGGTRVTVKTVILGETKTFGTFTARVVHVNPEEKTVLLDASDPVSGRNFFPIDNIISIHLV